MSSIGKVEQIPLQHILLATNNFSQRNFIAGGGFGEVYKGHSEEYGTIAVKRLVDHGISGQGQHEFMMEIELLSAYKHGNLVSLVGFCDQDGEKILVYKHESNGSLDKLLKRKDLNWIQRLQICLDAAKGLKYLHHDVGPQRRVVHRDVKSSNILLDENMKAKISDFGLSKISPTHESCTFLISNACGTIGYIDPEYLIYGVLTQKSDVYSFGIVLFEVLCGRLARLALYKDRRQFLCVLAPNHFEKHTLHEIIYSNIRDQMDPVSLKTFSTIAYRCLTKYRTDRPSMTEIVEQLQKALVEQHAASSGLRPGAALQQFKLYRICIRCFKPSDGNRANIRREMHPQQHGLSTSMDYMTQSGLMVSSSSSSQSTPAYSSQSWKHDVFISFKETDTRNTFVDHLCSAFAQQGIYTVYKEEEILPRGEAIDPLLLKAIEESRIAIIVFSDSYADSSWCLQELAHIMKCKDERGQIVIPIFYHIDPSELRKQKGKYGEALAKHESEGKNVESWRKALVDAGNLSGDVVNGPETIFIKGIVDTISERLCVAISSDDEDLIGMEARLQDLKSKLAIDSHDVLMVGIWGLGGGGKTTLASALYDEISGKFDGSCFVKDIREESSKHGLPKLQKEILSLVLKQKREEIVGDVGSLIKSRFRRKKVLMVLDDVDHADQLQELAGSNAWFGKGSRIIITTRDNHLLNAHKVNVIYNISLLNDDEAIKLFYKHAPRDHRHIEDYEMLSKDVVSYAGGLPLALKVLGSFLCDKDMSEWMSALDRLKEIPYGDIVEKLKISYDGLKPMEKELFLDIACFFRGLVKDYAMVILDACGFHPIIGVKVLIQKALITVSEEGYFEMHDLIQEMGHYIVRGENPKNPELHSRIWQEEDVVKICGMDATKENVIEALPFEWLRGMTLPHNLPYVVANMKKLRWISCYKYPGTSFSRNFQPMKLCYLQLDGSLLEKLWKGNKYLPNLKVLDLSNSINLIKTPDFGGLPCLERMVLRGCIRLKEIHPSIGYHERLIFLDMRFCESLKVFPPIIRMKKLETLILSYCDNLRKFPEIETSMDNLVELSLEGSGIKILPTSVGQYCTNLVYLYLSYCTNLESIEGNFHLLKHLKELNLYGCKELKNIRVEGLFEVKCCLQVLSSFKNLQRGMNLFGFSSSLRMLNLSECNLVDGDISSDFCKELPNLQVLDLSRNNFSQLHSSLSQLSHLKFLNLSRCSNLVELPDLPSSIAVLIASECNSLDIVGDFPTDHLKYLWKVTLSASNCNGERILQSMLQGNAIEDYFISIKFDEACIPIRGFARKAFTLQLPWNWQSEFSGLLVYVKIWSMIEGVVIIMKDVMGRENENDVLEISNEDEGSVRAGAMCYISFGSLRHTSWWNSSHDTISFSVKECSLFKVELVPKRSEVDSIERAKDTTNPSEFWDEESRNRKTVEIIHDSSSSINFLWSHCHSENVFHFT